ncbi:hypothetical protein DSECCO2_146680 [anaerobic digester metagenome]
MSDIDKEFERIILETEKYITEKLFIIGEMCVSYAKSNHTYLDDTGNLTASIGYGVYRNGSRIGGSVFGGPDEGATARAKALDELAKDVKEEWVLIVVAGMYYGIYVEALGYDVISGSKLIAEREAERMMKDLRKQKYKIKVI